MSAKREWFASFRYVAPADFENWLEGKARDGWILDHIGQWSSLKMTFRKGEPSTYRYVADMQVKTRPDYYAMYEDAGWEFVGRMASLNLWRRAYTGARPDAFTDEATVRARSNRFFGAVLTSIAVMAVGSAALLLAGYGYLGDMSAGDATQMKVAGAVFGAMALVLVPVAIRIKQRKDR